MSSDGEPAKRHYLTWAYATRGRGNTCPRCECPRSIILKTTKGPGGEIVRVRECEHCGKRRLTVEETSMEYPDDY